MIAAVWVRDGIESESWRFRVDGHKVYGYVSRYDVSIGAGGYNWQAVRGDHRLSGSEQSSEKARATAEKILALPVEEFNARVVADLLERFHELERQILSLRPDVALLPGYSAGYESGVADTRKKIEEALK